MCPLPDLLCLDILQVDKKGKVINEYYKCQTLDNARLLKKRKIQHLTESGLIEGTVVILDSKNKIVN